MAYRSPPVSRTPRAAGRGRILSAGRLNRRPWGAHGRPGARPSRLWEPPQTYLKFPLDEPEFPDLGD